MDAELKAAIDRLRSMAVCTGIDLPNAPAKAIEDMWLVARTYIQRLESLAVDDGPVTEEWLRAVGFRDEGLRGWTKLLPPASCEQAIAEMHIAFECDGLSISLTQDDRDHVLLSSLPLAPTRSQVIALCEALGVKIKEGG